MAFWKKGDQDDPRFEINNDPAWDDDPATGGENFNFTEQGEKLGYINNPDWVPDDEATRFHDPCGYWWKRTANGGGTHVWPGYGLPGGGGGGGGGGDEEEIPCECLYTLEIVNEDGSAATDTLLRNQSNDYGTDEDCCEEGVAWSVAAAPGSSLGGSIITGDGVLTVGASACGSLIITAECVSCGTIDTHGVRVSDAGQWVLIESCSRTNPAGCTGYCTRCLVGTSVIMGRYQYDKITRFNHTHSPCDTCCDTFCPDNPAPNPSPCTDGFGTVLLGSSCIIASSTYEWKC